MIDYTLVVGVDHKHLLQLQLVWPTWKRHKPSLLTVPMVVFYDRDELRPDHVYYVVDHPNVTTHPWPPEGVEYEGDADDKWSNPRRYRMLSGFVHVPGNVVETPYWLKLDTDAIAHGMDDWIDWEWFRHDPAIVSAGWPYTKPPNQMLDLDRWVKREPINTKPLSRQFSLNLVPKMGSDRLVHRRIGSWCAFFDTEFTKEMSIVAERTCGVGKLPVPSQDSYLWYCAKRLGREVVRDNMKKRGWELFATMPNIVDSAKRAMEKPVEK